MDDEAIIRALESVLAALKQRNATEEEIEDAVRAIYTQETP